MLDTDHLPYLPFDSHLRPARARLPVGACDCHAHLFDDSGGFPFNAPRPYTPTPARVVDYQALRDTYGIDRMILVHPMVYGADHSSFEYLLERHSEWMRGVAVVGIGHSEAQVARWHALGTRGTRINTLIKHGTPPESIPEIVARVRSFDWHVQVLCDVVEDPHRIRSLVDMGCRVVVDNLGSTSVERSLRSSEMQDLLALMREGRVWVKLSGAYRLSASRHTLADLQPLVDAFICANPRRVLWGTNWPHPLCDPPMPNDGDLVNALFDWLTAAERHQVLVENPDALYWGDAPGAVQSTQE